MTWGYDDTATPISDKDQVRILIGDTIEASQLVSDEVINMFLAEAGSVYVAASLTAGHIAAIFARKVDTTTGKVGYKYSQRYDHYTKLSGDLKRRGLPIGLPRAGGITVAQIDEQNANTTDVQPFFKRGMHDMPGTDRE